MRQLEAALSETPEVTDYTSYVGLPSPIDFNGLVRHYYLRTMPHQAEIRVNLVGKTSRRDASHALGLRERDRLASLAAKAGVRLKIVELPPGPPVIDTIAAEMAATTCRLFPGGGIPWNTVEGTRVVWSGEGEWKITLDVFRDLGLAFAAALVMIYVILVAQTGSFMIPVIVMLSIPLTMVGIIPGFWILGLFSGRVVGGYEDPVFFTATAMIGMIALSGIVTRQSIILVDFIHLSLRRGRSLMDAVLEAGAVRLRPILLVVAAAMLSAIPITADPIFSGLAWALIFGLIASTGFTLLVVPLVYWLLYKSVPGHGVRLQSDAG